MVRTSDEELDRAIEPKTSPQSYSCTICAKFLRLFSSTGDDRRRRCFDLAPLSIEPLERAPARQAFPPIRRDRLCTGNRKSALLLKFDRRAASWRLGIGEWQWLKYWRLDSKLHHQAATCRDWSAMLAQSLVHIALPGGLAEKTVMSS